MDDDFGLWDVIVSMFWFMLLVAWFWLILSILADLFRDRDMKGWGKALWALFIIVVPWLGALVYLLARGDSMHERERQRALDQQASMRAYMQPSTEAGLSKELRELAELRDSGVLTPAEYEQAKAKALS
jgi:Short C-terminal domain/Phospholipase_D-nuclease N-terminal